VLVTH